MVEPAGTPAAKKSNWANLLIDYGPILLFFLVYRHFAPADKTASLQEVSAVIYGTVAFIAGAVVALAYSLAKFRRVSPMLALSTALIVFFGGLTILLHDQFYIQIKPTVIYLMFGLALLGGWMKGKALLKILLEAAFEGLDDDGWMKLSRNWGWFFLFLAALNEGFRFYLSFGGWLQAKLYVFLPASFLFTFAHMPMLLRHGLASEARSEAASEAPHE
ncbi:septation protein IspZ [Novosphingobium flavum]|uniref:Inner membrane-spanning protein YciB n=1 Tax=Novosphingobium flavum TaxID=1778672 RepID=A0A7X1FQ60_9SPHN|nr:inner membrane-spanning protein YciB [Novosphingobium flavum]MBC2664853.1 septation protein IspZ [Novosphingobium flavum]